MRDDPGRDQPPEAEQPPSRESNTAEFILEPRPTRPPSQMVQLPTASTDAAASESTESEWVAAASEEGGDDGAREIAPDILAAEEEVPEEAAAADEYGPEEPQGAEQGDIILEAVGVAAELAEEDDADSDEPEPTGASDVEMLGEAPSDGEAEDAGAEAEDPSAASDNAQATATPEPVWTWTVQPPAVAKPEARETAAESEPAVEEDEAAVAEEAETAPEAEAAVAPAVGADVTDAVADQVDEEISAAPSEVSADYEALRTDAEPEAEDRTPAEPSEDASEAEIAEEQAELVAGSQIEMADMEPETPTATAALVERTAAATRHLAPSRMWITTALLCSAPVGEPARRTWRFSPGGPLHPLKPTVASASFPVELPLAIHLRVQGTGEGHLTVWMEDQDGQPLQWSDGTTERVRFPVTLLQTGDALLEFANTLVIPGVHIERPGRYRVVVQLGSDPNAEPDLDQVQVPLSMFTPRQLPQIGQPEDPPLDDFLRELWDKLSVDVRRSLRHAAVEARRLGRGSIFVDHLLIALGRTLGPRSGLGRLDMLRDIVEMSTGLYAPFVGQRQIRVASSLAELIRRQAASTDGALGAPGLMRAVLSEPQGLKTYQWLVEQADLLSRQPSP